MEIYRGGIIDKTKMYEADSRTGRHDISIWVLYSCLLLEIVRQKVFCGFLQKRFKITRIVIIAIKASFSAQLISFKASFWVRAHLSYVFPKISQKLQDNRLTRRTIQVVWRPRTVFWYLCKKLHLAFTAAGTDCYVCARKLSHYFFKRSHFLCRWRG